jgi:hypothetical protein
MISREKLLSQNAKRYVDKKIFGEDYRIQSLSEREKADYEIKLQDKKSGMSTKKARALFLCRVLVDEANNRLLRDDDVDAVGEMDGRIASAIYAVALDHNGYDETDIEELVKNSEGATG